MEMHLIKRLKTARMFDRFRRRGRLAALTGKAALNRLWTVPSKHFALPHENAGRVVGFPPTPIRPVRGQRGVQARWRHQ